MNQEQRNLRIETSRGEGHTVVKVSGEVDLRSSPALRESLHAVTRTNSGRIILDLTEVGYVDSSGVGTLVEAKRRADVVLVGLQPRVRSVFEITRLDQFFKITDTVEQARQA